MRTDLPSGIVTFLFTDVEGSTRLLHALGAEAYAEALAEHRRVIREACVAQGGVEVDTQGDAFFFAFPTASGAVVAASAFTEQLRRGPIQVRVGLHTGTPLLADEGYVGEDVHFAARVAATSHGGQVVCSQSTRAACDDQLQALVSLGSHRLKDIAGPVSIFQVGEGSFPPLKTIANSNLPTPASSFLGRQEELYEADELLQSTRLLTIAGPGGQGKTRFALELATRAREERFSDYPDGVFACFLASLRDPGLVLPTICQTLDVAEQPGQSALDALAAHLQGKRMLVLLDNLEHLLSCAPELSRLLHESEGATLLVTSREVLRISGETSYALPPLAEREGIGLFCERARLESSPAIAELCRRLEGLPLAIELAAARTAILTPQQLLERLTQRLDLFKGNRDADPRQQTLRATIEWSYDLLASDEQRLLRAMSVFRGGCTLEAAEEVAAADLDLLQALVDKSLLRFAEERFWMLETIREYAAERLTESGLAEIARQRHASWVADVLDALSTPLRKRDPAALAAFRRDENNGREAMAWALEQQAPELAQRLFAGLWFPMLIGGGAREGDEIGMAVASLESEPTESYGVTLAVAGEFARFRAEPERAVQLKERAVAVLEALPQTPSVLRSRAWTHGDLAHLAIDLGELEEADDHVEKALALWRQLDDDPEWGAIASEGHALSARAVLEERRGNLVRAAALHEDNVRRLEERGAHGEAGGALYSLGEVRRQLGDVEGARSALEESFDRASAADDRAGVADVLASLACLALDEGDPTRAVELLARVAAETDEAAISLEQAARARLDETTAACRAALGEHAFAEAWAQGLEATASGRAARVSP